MYPDTDESAQLLSKIKTGSVVFADVKRPRNYLFHKKFFALLQVGFDAWEPDAVEFNGLPAQKNFDRFRKDCVISAGYYDTVVNLKGDVRAEAKSISFGAMDESEFAELYSSVANVLLQRVLRNYTREDLDETVERILGFV